MVFKFISSWSVWTLSLKFFPIKIMYLKIRVPRDADIFNREINWNFAFAVLSKCLLMVKVLQS